MSFQNNSFFALDEKPSDRIFGLNKRFAADQTTNKINLGIGVYKGTDGKNTPALRDFDRVEAQIKATNPDRGYLPIMGHDGFRTQIQSLVLGSNTDVISEKRVLTAQTIGGTGALRIAAELTRLGALKRGIQPVIWVSTPTWENHHNIFSLVGYTIKQYSYYDQASGRLDFNGMLSALKANARPSDIVLLHACCHNPTGVDISKDQWKELVSVFESNKLIPFFDFAYHGFGDGITEDRTAIDLFIKAGIEIVVAYSCTKNFSAYNQRIGACLFVANDPEVIPALVSQLEPLIRANYSNGPAYGARIVAEILGDPKLRGNWETEVGEMRSRIKEMRAGLINALCAGGLSWRHLNEHRGMFSYLPLNSEQIEKLITKHHIYGLDSGGACRINVAALTRESIPRVAESILDVVRG